MSNYICWIAAVLIAGILVFLSGNGNFRQRNIKYADRKIEKKYSTMAKQLQRFKKDDEYRKLKQKVEKELRYGSSDEQREQLLKRLYAVRVRKEQEESGISMATGLIIPSMILYIFLASVVPLEYWRIVIALGWSFLLVYVLYLFYKIPRKVNYCRLSCVIESLLTELDNTWREKREEQENGDIDTLVNKLTQGRQEEASAS